ncbi:Calcium/proton exchanger [Aureobasidium pullulans]|nr:Calcium/proton exchanger [Aureobasidium pullulans]
MHSIKHQARNIAWRYNDGESNYNPFARRSRSYVGRPEDEENNLQRRHTADQVMSDSSIRRNDMRNVDNADFAYPHHANTAPPDSSASSDAPTSNGTLVGQSDIKPSKEKESIPLDRDNSRSMSEKPHTESEHKPRKRLALMNLLGQPDRTKTDSSDLERSDTGDTKKRRPKISIVSQFKATILGSWVNVLLVCVPIGFALRYSHANGYAVFIVNFIAIIPLAAMLSFATEELALYVGETLGGLLNASFGNATELIVSIIALAQNKILIVQTSLIGSMLSNLLLVLGMCFFFGGINRVTQHFNITVAQTASSMLAVSIGSLIIPTAFQRFGNNPQGGVGPISRGTSVILLLVYLAYLTFQLKTHVEIYNTPSQKSEKKKGSAREKGDTLMGLARIGAGTAASAGGQVNQSNLVYEEEEEETPALSVIGALVTLTIATVFIAFNSEFMVSGIDYIVEHGNISEEFVGLILVPIVGNAAEHATAVTVAIKDKMDLAIGVAVGSSMQIALLVLPLMVVISWCGLGNDPMTLDFDGFQVAVLFIAVLLVNYLIQDGESHWLEGILLMATYIIIAVSAWFYPASGDLSSTSRCTVVFGFEVMSFTNRKIKKFDLPDGIQSIIVEDEPDQEYSNEDHEPKSENPIKTEPEDDPRPDKDMDINEYMGANTSTPYVEITTEPDVQAGAEEEIQSAQESTSVSAAPTVPITPVGLGNSILQAPHTAKVGNRQTSAELEALQSAQVAFYAQMAETRPWSDSEEDDLENEEESEDPIALERSFVKEKKIHEKKQQEGQLTQDEEMDFMKLESKYNKKRQEFAQLADIEDTVFIPEHAKSKASQKTKRKASELSSDSENEDVPSNKHQSKKGKTTKSKPRKSARKSQPSPSLDFVTTTNNFWENTKSAQQMNDAPRVQGGRDRTKALAIIKKNLPAESKAAAVRDGKRLVQAMRDFSSKKGDTGRNYSIETTDDGWRVKGMNVSLKNYQVVSAAWMRLRERPESDVKGGIIAHQMGLGKTVTCLANIVNGRPLHGQNGTSTDCATTLIVLPSWAMVAQWKSEILIHTMEDGTRKKWGLGQVFVYRDSMKEDSQPKNFGLYDVVLTTYGDVRRSWPECEYPEGLSDKERGEYFQEHWDEKVGPLHKYDFLRVVLDEGHKIANPETQAAKACFRLKSEYRWILTGTPMVNGAQDLYSLLCFIKHPSTLDKAFEAWKSQYCDPKKPMSMVALSHILKPHFSCWAHNDKFMNAVLVRLPKPRNLPLELYQSILEHEIYEVFRERFKTRAQTLDEDGNVKSARFHIFAMYTFLRQMTAHPLLVSGKVCDYLEMSDFDKLENAVRRQEASSETPTSMIHALKSVMKQQRARVEARTADSLKWDSDDPSSIIDELDEGVNEIDEVEKLKQPAKIKKNNKKRGAGGKHGRSVESGAFVECLKRSSNSHISEKRSQCCKCKRDTLNPIMTGCYHFYCESHYLDLIEDPSLATVDQAICVKEGCGKTIDRAATIDPNAPIKPRWLDADNNVLPSTKTLAIKATVLNWLERDPKCKLILFTQWRGFLDMLARICEAEGWGYVTLHGGLNKKLKEDHIRQFKTSAEKQILIATLKTGGEGLNLTCANFVINVDPYWNAAAEVQAFSRVYRISQEKETEFVNLTLAGTIDEKLNAIKLRKKTQIDGVEGTHKKLTTQDMLMAFEASGSISEDSSSN